MANIEAAQKAQFLEFSQAWDNYMSDYEATAYLSLEKLKVSLLGLTGSAGETYA